MVKSAKHTKLGSAATVLLAIASAGLGCESILGLTSGKSLCEGITCLSTEGYECNLPGICDELTGKCSYPVAMDKTPCDDHDPCTIGDACQGGQCEPGTRKMCEPPDGCSSSVDWDCDRATGMCLYYGLEPYGDMECAGADDCSSGGKCRGGICVLAPIPDAEGHPCNLGDSCTQAGTCTKGKCAGGTVLEDGATCNDGSVCTMLEGCLGGVCNPEGDHTWARWDLKTSPSLQRYVMTASVVFDKITGLTWEREPAKDDITWDAAKSHCASFGIPAYNSRWRLPTRIELASIVDYNRSAPAIDTGFFIGESAYYWTSSHRPDTPDQFWTISFTHGYVGTNDRMASQNLRVRCVR